jgi:hypothetical protein
MERSERLKRYGIRLTILILGATHSAILLKLGKINGSVLVGLGLKVLLTWCGGLVLLINDD